MLLPPLRVRWWGNSTMSLLQFIRKNKVVALIIILIALGIYLMVDLAKDGDGQVTGQAIASLFKSKEFSLEIVDKCGMFYNLFSHTVSDEADCRTKCKNQCHAQDAVFKDAVFSLGQKSCNTCKCYCRG